MIFQHSTSSNCSETSTNSFLDWPDVSSPQDIDPDSVRKIKRDIEKKKFGSKDIGSKSEFLKRIKLFIFR